MTITIAAKSVYGKTVYYVQDDAADAIARLTGKKTVDKRDIEALIKLGLQVNVIELPL